MMEDAIDRARASALLMEAVATTFADMAFIDVEPASPGASSGELALSPAGEGVPGAAAARAAIDVLRPLSCRIEIECPASLKERIEATLVQGEGGNEEDSLLEILNVAAGVFLTAYFGPGADIKLELPQYLFLSEGAEGTVLAEGSADAEGHALRAVLRSIRYRY